MTKFLLSVHVLAAILAIGPVAVAASMFAPAARQALAHPDDPRAVAVVRTLHRICRVYAALGIAVPVFGVATALSLGVLGQRWLMVAIALTAAAALVLVLIALPAQRGILEEITATPDAAGPVGMSAPAAAERGVSERGAVEEAVGGQVRGLAMATGLFNLLWAAVTILMVVRPGSTTGA